MFTHVDESVECGRQLQSTADAVCESGKFLAGRVSLATLLSAGLIEVFGRLVHDVDCHETLSVNNALLRANQAWCAVCRYAGSYDPWIPPNDSPIFKILKTRPQSVPYNQDSQTQQLEFLQPFQLQQI